MRDDQKQSHAADALRGPETLQWLRRRVAGTRPGLRPALALLLLTALVPLPPRAACRAGPPQPNFVLILADDLGYGDLSIQGSDTIATPRIDRLALSGIRFTDAYAAAPYCSPSRAALLTGRLPARCGLPYVLFPAERHGLPGAEITLARLLKGRGYTSACIGKWHLGSAPEFHPLWRGFDVFFGLPYSNDSDEWPVGKPFLPVMGLQPLPLFEGTRIVEAPVDQETLTQRYTERAVAFMRANRERPFFLYLAHTMPHIPQYAGRAFAGKSRGGLYGDAVEEIDWSTGVILDALAELGIEDRTLVCFTSDNGAPSRKAAQAPPGKGAGRRAGEQGGRFPGRSFFGSNAPLRGGKGTVHEGGVRVPLIIRWPGDFAAGSVLATPVSLMDLYPTFARLAGASLPKDRVIDGCDLQPLLRRDGEAGSAADRALVYYFGYQAQAVREGRWKLVLAADRRPAPRPVSLWWDHQPGLFETQHRLLARPELYDLERDPAESANVAAANPQIARRLADLAGAFDALLQRDLRPMEFAPGEPAPAPRTVRPHPKPADR